ncbi:MAG: isocitrate lyase/phosphoenolpyruvate mutase family protein [Spirochaetia bacterium]|nr:isocitrate lyase/phosphoenolpyruvate mutase family protein [Spirochaetia bacterium]
MISQAERGLMFRTLHNTGTFIMPNAWDAGSARMLVGQGFKAIATTSAGIAFAAGLPDHQKLSRDAMLAEVRKIVQSVNVPVSADLEGGYGIAPNVVAETVRMAIEIGVVGCNIEDLSGNVDSPLIEPGLAAERISAIRKVADAQGISFTLTARTDAFLTKHPMAFDEAVRRCNQYRQAGADCLFVPGVGDSETIGNLVRAIDGPMNFVMGLAHSSLNAKELSALGVRRISIGGSLARASFGLIRAAAQEMQTSGTFTFADNQYPHGELCDFFSAWDQ